MKCDLPIRPVLIAALAAIGAIARADVGISVNIAEPGFYGRLDIGGLPVPTLRLPQPIVIAPVPPGIVPQPIYLRVPPGYERHWAKHCREYNACGVPVYFVGEDWYQRYYRPRGHWRDRDDGDDEGHWQDHDRGRGHEHGHGHGHDDDD